MASGSMGGGGTAARHKNIKNRGYLLQHLTLKEVQTLHLPTSEVPASGVKP